MSTRFSSTIRDHPAARGAVLRAVLTRSVVAIPDVLEDNDYAIAIGAHSVAGGFRSVLAVPLMHEGSAIGGIAVGRPQPGPFPDNQVALLQTFADQAVIAIENVRLFTELEARTTQLTRSVERAEGAGRGRQAVSSTLDLETVLRHDRFARDRAYRHGWRLRLRVRRGTRGIPSAHERTVCPASSSRRSPRRRFRRARARWAVWR